MKLQFTLSIFVLCLGGTCLGLATTPEGDHGYMLLSDGTTHRDSAGKPPTGQYYVTGNVLADKTFELDKDATVQGKGKDCPKMSDSPGYRLLKSGEYQSMQAGAGLHEPYVEGCRRGSNFLPKAPPTIEQPKE